MNINNFQISKNKTLREALELIDRNKSGTIFIIDADSIVIGVATDGDIRRKLLEGVLLDDGLENIYNDNFISYDITTSRETLIKKLDTVVSVIPLLDSKGRLVDIASRKHYPITKEEKIFSQSRAPVRISFGGGGSDLTHYFDKEQGAVINSAISIYSHATLKKRNDKNIIINSTDLKKTLTATSLEDAVNQKGSFGLIQSVIKLINPDFGFELSLYSDFPMKSGLGGSATLAAAILGCFNQFRSDPWDQYEMAELAFQAERLDLGIAGGWQDQYASVFGGFNFLEFKKDQNIVHPLRIPKDILLQLEESLILCDTCTIHESGEIHSDQKNKLQDDGVSKLVKSNVELCYKMRNQLLRGKLKDFGLSLNEAWQAKRQYSSKISSPELDLIYNKAISNGATGGKLLGAGGGGFFLFFVEPEKRALLIEHLLSSGLTPTNFKFESEGLQGWKVRESSAYK
ncbi:CBS domain-containing protein [Gammaproteobacteria bacterium]|nr:CBS domain-containing protein [Gammaproteobacteria bacterium]